MKKRSYTEQIILDQKSENCGSDWQKGECVGNFIIELQAIELDHVHFVMQSQFCVYYWSEANHMCRVQI